MGLMWLVTLPISYMALPVLGETTVIKLHWNKSLMLYLSLQKYSKNIILKQYNNFKYLFFYLNTFENVFFSVIKKLFSSSLLTWSFRNHSNMLICCSRNIFVYYWCWNSCATSYFLWKTSNIWLIEISKEQHSFEIEMNKKLIKWEF